MSLKFWAGEILQATQKSALNCMSFVGSGDKMGADQVATQTMRDILNEMDISATIVIGEGERDEAPMLYIGEKLGKGGIKIDIAVDPLEGTNLCAYNLPGSITVMAIGPEGTLMNAPDTYMQKLVVGRKVGSKVSLNKTVSENIKTIANSYQIGIYEVCIILLDRDRNDFLVKEILSVGAKIKYISDGDIMGGIQALISEKTGVHALMGIGAAPEGVITACAVKTLGGYMEAKFMPYDDKMQNKIPEILNRMQKMLVSEDKIYTMDDLAKGDDLYFLATGVTDGPVLKGCEKYNGKLTTYSVVGSTKNKTWKYIQEENFFNE